MQLSRRLAALTLLCLMAALPPAFAAQPGPLNILLTNDDGWDAVGIQAMKTALTAAGHNVTLVAPLTNQSGKSASLTLDLVDVQAMSANEFAVDGTPATCVLLGISAILPQRPHLVISGTNHGKNVGPDTPFSGTVGATIAALRAGLPAIALSTDPPNDDPTSPAFLQHYANVASFTVRLVQRLKSSNPSPGVLPARTALNVNYPTLAPSQVQGVVVRVQGQAAPGILTYTEVSPGVFAPSAGPPPPGETEVPGADGPAVNAGFVTVVPIDGNYTAGNNFLLLVALLLGGLQP